ncbi:hypothetical protein AVEN_147437-1 [Araneus ventricosus]|uniref:Uncharacterized protein n=1 Tax=Araneus ventricosus TaxID=182803 RepID=A0A4Y2PND3_ARAVE|nr:hypothetical protein AVEN_147437-1 [Araneus ventricosus]
MPPATSESAETIRRRCALMTLIATPPRVVVGRSLLRFRIQIQSIPPFPDRSAECGILFRTACAFIASNDSLASVESIMVHLGIFITNLLT